MRSRPILSGRIDEHTLAAALVSFALLGVVAFVVLMYFFTPS